MEQISKIDHSMGIYPWSSSFSNSEERKNKKRFLRDKPKKYFKALAKLVAQTHEELIAEHSPFRICVNLDGDNISLDVVIVDDNGKAGQKFHHAITTNLELEKLIDSIYNRAGLICDVNI
jgi:hypothetical protein